MQDLRTRLDSAVTNQTQVMLSLNTLQHTASILDSRLQDFNKRIQSCEGENMRDSLAHLDLKVTDMSAGLDSVKNTTRWNSHSLRNLADSINQIKQDNFGLVNSSSSSISDNTTINTTETSMLSSNDKTVKDVPSTTEKVQEN